MKGAMSVGGQSGFHDQFADLFSQVLFIPYPDTWAQDEDVEKKESAAFAVLEEYLRDYKDRLAAIIVEPLVQGASGMRCCRPEFLRKVIELVQNNNILVIFDEIMTGFCRTGTYFALDQLSLTPDFLCVSKGITGGFLPLALTVTNESIYKAFLGDEFKRAFAHGHSYTGNPLACSAATASLNLLKSPACQDAIVRINQAHQQGVDYLQDRCPFIEKTRVIGTICAFEIPHLPQKFPHIKSQFLEAGLLLRPLGDVIYLLPPYSTSVKELEQAYEKIANVLAKSA